MGSKSINRSKISLEDIPKHISIIMDGNGRWATKNHLDVSEGHIAGYKNIRPVISELSSIGVEFVTVYAFSTENWGRPKSEVQALMELAGSVIKDEVKAISEENIKLTHAGDLNDLSNTLRSDILKAVEDTKNNSGLTLCVAFNYGGRQEIINAVKKIILDEIDVDEINLELFSTYLYVPELPYPDLVIRTGGEFRISNFLIWQSAYSEFFSTPVLWPNFGSKEINEAIENYGQRQRRFGRR